VIIPDENPSTSRRWDRPIPRIGDTTSSATRAADPTGWSLGDQVQQGLDIAIDTRRDIRRYRHDDVPKELVNTVLWAGHRAPSVGHSQPWRFVVVRDADIRDRAAVMADRERLRQADLLTPVGAPTSSTSSSKGSARPPSASLSHVTVEYRPQGYWDATRSPTPTCGVAPAPSRICGSLPELTAWGWGG